MEGRIHYKTILLRSTLVVAVGLALFADSGCTSSSSGSKSSSGASETASSDSPGAQIDTNCVGDHIENPPEAFHYSFKKVNGADSRQEDADITPQAMDGTLTTNASKPYSFHGVRSDSASWDGAVLNLTGAVGMLTASAGLLSHSSSMTREGTEAMNGYDTTRYSIDTTRGNEHDKGAFGLLLGPGGSAKGMVWVTSQGCPAKLVLDEEVRQINGGMNKLHYEMAMIKR